MRKLVLRLVIIFSLFNILTVTYAKPLENVGPTYDRSDEEMGREEGLVKLNWPLKYLRYDLKDLLLKEGSAISSLSKIDLNPIDRTLHLDGKLIIPDSLLLTMEEKAGDKLMNEHSFSFIIQFPQYVRGRYVEFQFKRFQLDGIDYSKGFHIISRIVPALLVNKSLMNYFLDDSKAPTDYKDTDLSKQIKYFIDNKIVEFNNDTIRINFNLKHFTSFKRYADFDELRIWYFGPKKIKGTKAGVQLVIEGGIGVPAVNYIKQVKADQKEAKEELLAIRKDEYEKYSYNISVKQKIEKIVDQLIAQTGFTNWNSREKIEIQDIKRMLNTKASVALQVKDPYFSDEPELASQEFLRLAKEYATNAVLDLKKRHALDLANRNGGREAKDMPFAVKKLSQKAVNQFTNFFRDFELDEGEPLFSKLNVVLAPQLPGIIIKGDVNLNINSLFEMGLEGEGIDFSGPAIRPDDKTYGKAVPFELSLYTFMRDNGVLELDIRNAAIGEGSNRVILNPHNDKGDFLEEFTKMTIVNILKTYLMSDPMASVSEDDQTTPERSRDELFGKIHEYKRKILSVKGNSNGSIIDLIKIKEIDLSNPFNEVPAQIAEQETIEFFKNILGYDRDTGRIKIFLDPTIFSEKIFYADNKVQLWNLEPLYDKVMDKTYMELAIGNDTRSSQYLDHIYERNEKEDSLTFTGTTGNKANEGPVDYGLKIDLKEFENTVNSILTASLIPHSNDIKNQLSSVEEGSFNTLEDLTIEAIEDNTLALKISLNSIEKKKKNILARTWNNLFDKNKKKYTIENNRSSVTARIHLSSVPVEKYKNKILKNSPNEIFLGDSLVKIDLEAIGYKTINGGIFSKVLNKMIGNVNLKNGIIGSNLKKLILKIAGPFLNERGNKNGSTVLAGFHLNNYAKLYTQGDDILIQINPRFSGPVWDFYMLANSKHKDRKIGLNIDKRSNTLALDFVSAFTASTVDKIEMYNVMKEALKIADDIIDVNKLSYIELLKVYDRLFYNNDRSKMSLYHRFLNVVNNYEEIALIGHSKDLHALAKDPNFNLTSAGAELMHIATAASALYRTLSLAKEISPNKEAVQYSEQIEDIMIKLKGQFIDPFVKLYEIKFSENNMRILNKNVTDWNYLVYPDALFSQKAYQYLIQ